MIFEIYDRYSSARRGTCEADYITTSTCGQVKFWKRRSWWQRNLLVGEVYFASVVPAVGNSAISELERIVKL